MNVSGVSNKANTYQAMQSKSASAGGTAFAQIFAQTRCVQKASSVATADVPEQMGLELEQISENVSKVLNPEAFILWNNTPHRGAEALICAEKYGLSGLSEEEQIKSIMSGVTTSNYTAFSEAIDKLVQIGILPPAATRSLSGSAQSYAMMREMETNGINDWNQNRVWHESNMLSQIYNWRDVFKKESGNMGEWVKLLWG